MNWAPYAQYRAVDTTWLGKVPDHWETRNPKSLFRLRREPSHEGDRQLTASQSDGVVYQDEYMENRGTRVVQVIEGQAGLKHVAAGDFVISLRSFQGGIEYSAAAGKISPAYTILKPNSDVGRRYFVHLLKSDGFVQELRSTSNQLRDGQSLGLEHFAQVRVPLPPKSEQHAIAKFLDHETAKIDALIDKQEQLIATLREDRAATISQAVTKGLNPGVELANSESGLPAAPAHWSVGPVKRFLHSLDHRRIPLSTTERGVRQGTHPYYGASGVIDFVDDYLFDEPLLLVSEDGANLLGRRTPIAFVAAGKYWVNNHAHILKPIENEPPSFWAYRIETASIAPFVTGSAQPKFTIEALMNMPITAPPTVTERREIVAYLEHRCSKIDELIAKSTEMIGTLREYRSALITNAVTGKIDVREAV